ncbi:sterol desaturase family protein [Francisella frigiditurris]|uniref:Fatty acid hydroxylase superfamily protein n=1 Tax=Francisella frigiditurris TaxID=1542390 RepID=A0A1J0KSS9_9GAMM|nr:sterol desaturase family protein [Francisella frigiditurris]APC96755.1 fatty acid hydroxylase superfamily protein [Francisella frigiditurris]
MGYWSDFYIYPIFILGFLILGIEKLPVKNFFVIIVCFFIGLLIWTFVEYLVHRFLFHSFPFLERMHGIHHNSPMELFGNPTFISLPIYIVGMFLPLFFIFGLALGSIIFSGFLIGSLLYFFIHHATHHIRAKKGSILFFYKKYHAIHHYNQKANYAVTFPLWDSVFRTKNKKSK